MPRVRSVRSKAEKGAKPWRTFTCGQVDYTVWLLPESAYKECMSELGEDPDASAAVSFPHNGVVIVSDTGSPGMNEVLLVHEMMHVAVSNIAMLTGRQLGMTDGNSAEFEEAMVEFGAPRMLEALRSLK